jgi:hypothetical protein
MHLVISDLPQLGHLNLAVPSEFETSFLQDEHINFSSDIKLGIRC